MEGSRALTMHARGSRQMPSAVIWPLSLTLHAFPAVDMPMSSKLAGGPGVYDLSDYYPRCV